MSGQDISSVDVLLICGSAIALIMMLRLLIRKTRKSREQKKLTHSPIPSLSPLEFEQYIAGYVEKEGYSHVRLTPKSGDFGADVLATDPSGKQVCVQCKKYSKSVGVSAVQEVLGAIGYYDCDRAMVFTTVGYTSAALQLAQRNGVELYTIH